MTARKTRPEAVTDGLATVDASIGRTAERIQSTQRSLDRYRDEYAALIALRQLIEGIRA